MSKTIDIRHHHHQQATPSSSSTYSNMTSSGSSSNTNNTASEESRRKLRYNDSFDQPEEPFECDVSAILPVKRTTGLSLLSDYEDSEVVSFNSDNEDFDTHDQDNESLAPSERRLAQQERKSPRPQQQPDDIQARYLEVEPAWSPLQEGDYVDAQDDPGLYQQAHATQQHHLNDPRSDHSSYSSQLYQDDPVSGHARLSTIAEVSELPSINITNTRPHLQQRQDNMPQGPVVISGDLALEDLFVEGQDDLMNEEIRQRLLANLKPTDILGPLHATHDFRLSTLTHTRHPSEHAPAQDHDQEDQVHEHVQEQEQEQEQEQDEAQQQLSQQSFERADGESDLSSHALALKREYEAMFGSRGAVDSERGSDASGLLVYENSEDMYEQDEDDDEDEFFGEGDEEDDEDEEFYAMLDMNGGGGNMILGNNIPRKPRVLAPPAGSRLPVPGSAIKQKVPLALQSNIVSRVPPPKTSSSPPQPSTPATPTQNAMTQRAIQPPSTSTPRAVPASGLRVPQVAAKRAVSPPAAASAPITPQATASQLLKASSSILDGLYVEDEEEQESHPKESAGAILARQYAEEILRKEKLAAAAAAQGTPKPSMLRPPSKIQPRVSALPDMPDDNNPLPTQREKPAPPTGTTIPRNTSSLAPTRPTGRTSSIAPAKAQARPTSRSPLQHSVPAFANDETGRSSPRPMSASTATVAGLKAREQLRANQNGSPTRPSGAQPSKSRPTSMYTSSAERHSPSVSRSASPLSNAARSNGLRSSIYEQSTHSPSVSRNVSPTGSNNPRPSHGLRSSMYEPSTSTRSPPGSEETPAKTSTLRRHSSKEIAYESTGARRRQSTERLVRSTSYERKQQLQRELEEIEAEEAALEKREAQEEDAALERRLMEARKLSIRTSQFERQQDLRRRSSSKDLYSSSEHHHHHDHHHQRRSSQHERESSAPTSPLSSPRSPRSSGGLSSKRSSLYGAHGDRLVPTLEESCKQLARIRRDIAELRDEIHQDQPGSAALSPPLQPLLSATSGMGRMSLGSKRHSIRDREEKYHHGRRLSMEERRASYAHEATRLQQLGLGRSDSYNSSSVPSSPEAKCLSPPPPPLTTKRNMFGEILGKLSMSVGSRPSASSSSNHRHQQSGGQAAVAAAAAAAVATGADGCPAQIRPKELRFSSSIAGEVQSFVTLFNRSRRQMRFEILRPAGITVTPSFGIIQPGRDQRLTVHLAENRGPGRVVVELDGEWLVPFGVAFD
ncbi:hypothetical protein EC968_007644 [Mortierella alpina]|nr:hypothetical protein EC968_007644 [Mortierella alpina]